MTWTYSGDPSTSSRDELRFLIGDTDDSRHLLADEELDYLLADMTGQSKYLVAAFACDLVVAATAKAMTKTVGGLSLQYGERLNNYKDLADRLRKFARTSAIGAPVLSGGGTTYLGPAMTEWSTSNNQAGESQ